MGVVRDVTIDQLTQAVQGISSAGMTDTTGQDIKDSIDALDMTAGTLGKDTSLQAIKNSIDSLTTALTNDKANRDASNVTDASAWRSAIGVNDWTLLPNSTMDLSDTLDITGCGREIMIEINSNPTSPSNRGRILVPVRKDGANFYIAGGSNNSLVLVRLSISSANILTFVNISNTNLRIQGVFI